jgi:hypothetical protein
MDATASSADRALILGFLQEAVDQIAVDAEINTDATQSVSLTSGTSLYTLGSSPFNISDLISIQEIQVSDGSSTSIPLQQITMSELRGLQQGAGQANATPSCYAVDYPSIIFYPTPGAGTTLNVSYVADSVTLADSGTALTFIPKAFQYGCVAEFATALAKQYKQDKTWSVHMERYQQDRVRGLPALRRWKSRVGGRERPQSLGFNSYVTSPSQDTWSL